MSSVLAIRCLPVNRVGLTNNGWTSNDQCIFWFENCLVPQIREKCIDDNERVLVIFDGHHSHLTDELFDLACANNIDFYCLPSHTTHKCQPLDVGVFSPLSKRWVLECEAVVEETGQKICRGDFIKMYMKVRDEVISPDIVKTAWRKTGLDPFNPNIFTPVDFAPSRPYSTHAHFPSSFPASDPEGNACVQSEMDTSEDTTVAVENPASQIPLTCKALDSPIPLDDSETTTLVSNTAHLLSSSVPCTPPSPQLLLPAGSDAPISETDPVEATVSGETGLAIEATESGEMGPVEDTASLIQDLIGEYIPLRGPRVPEFTRTKIGPRRTLTSQVKILQDDLTRLLCLYEAEFKRRHTAEAHCALALQEIKRLKVRLNAKDKDKQRKTHHFGSKAVALMLPEVRQERECSRAEKQQKDQAKADKENKQADKERADMERRAGLAAGTITAEFHGNLKTMKKPELQDIAFLLGIKEYGSLLADSLRAQIRERLVEKQDLYRSNSRFKKLYSTLDRELPPATAPSIDLPSPHDLSAQSGGHGPVDMFSNTLLSPSVLSNIPPPNVPILPHTLGVVSLTAPQPFPLCPSSSNSNILICTKDIAPSITSTSVPANNLLQYSLTSNLHVMSSTLHPL
jgi:hypothetical protein